MIRTENLTKKYENFLALDNLTLNVAEKEIFGYIGPNGSGKTTTIRILAGMMAPTAGKAEVGGIDVVAQPRRAKEVVGYCPDAVGVYRGMRVWEYLDFFAAAHRIPKAKRQSRVDDVLKITGADEMKDYFVDSLSHGMRQRVGIARTLIHDPKVLFLDEPTNGLDPRARIEMRALLKTLQQLGKTILVSSHILPELATTCDRVGIIEQGKMLLCDRVERVLHQIEDRRMIEIEVTGEAGKTADYLKTKTEVQQVVGNMIRVSLAGKDEDIVTLLAELVKQGHGVLWYREVPVELEHVYLKITAAAKAGKRRVDND
ncbi:MAG: Vitamin B12 import ATP-binding protein BtuD [Verrucomicrobiae bacterium]|nr:Vitamin B12 import ATP-binding protein BtuD [Verrucomicrobiae bacterium]